MEKIDIGSPIWVQLLPRGLKCLTNYCAGFNRLSPELPGRMLTSFTCQNGWYRFSIIDLSRIFGPLMGDGNESLILDNEIHLKQPF